MQGHMQLDQITSLDVHEGNLVVVKSASPLARAQIAVELQGDSYTSRYSIMELDADAKMQAHDIHKLLRLGVHKWVHSAKMLCIVPWPGQKLDLPEE